MPFLLAAAGIALLTAGMHVLREQINPITVALFYLLFILFVATVLGSKPAVSASVAAMFCFNFFFLPPIGTLTISDPQNWVALLAFLVVSLVAGQLSAQSKRRAEESERLYRDLQNAFERESRAEADKQSEKLKSALLDAVTHDLRTPLTSIKASVTMLIEESRTDAARPTLDADGRAELLEVIDEETDRLDGFVESMMEVARLETGDFYLRKTEADVDDIILVALRRAQNSSPKRRIVIKTEENLPPIKVDAKAITEAIYNLIDNAVKYSPADASVFVTARKVENYLEVAVEDEGAGVPVEEWDKIFQKFYRHDKTAKGYGMGLAIVRGIVESHGGRVWVENGKKGARFVFELPFAWKPAAGASI